MDLKMAVRETLAQLVRELDESCGDLHEPDRCSECAKRLQRVQRRTNARLGFARVARAVSAWGALAESRRRGHLTAHQTAPLLYGALHLPVVPELERTGTVEANAGPELERLPAYDDQGKVVGHASYDPTTGAVHTVVVDPEFTAKLKKTLEG